MSIAGKLFLISFMAVSPVVNAITIMRLYPSPPKPAIEHEAPPKTCRPLLESLAKVPESLDEHFVPAFFARVRSLIERVPFDFAVYGELEGNQAFQKALGDRRFKLLPKSAALRLVQILRIARRRGIDQNVAQFVARLQKINYMAAAGGDQNDFGGVPQFWRKLEASRHEQLEESLKELHAIWITLDAQLQHFLVSWLGQILQTGFRMTSIHAWRVRELTLPIRPPNRELSTYEIGSHWLALYEPSNQPGWSVDQAIRDLLLSLRR